MKRTLDRKFYIPKNYDTRVVPKGILAEIYLFNHGKPAAMGFGGKRAAPDFHFTFADELKRNNYVSRYIDTLRDRKKTKDERKAKAKAFEHTLKADDILYSSWGYDQTNIDFYQVTKLVGKKSIELRKISGAIDHHDGCQSNMVVGRPGAFLGEAKLKRVQEGNRVKVRSFAWAHPWSGSPVRETDAYSGH